ncbi:MAG TPA: GntR family transcriptional regulator [Tepidisphaeraceae bacterium]|nr:GntR family transcriptional regulator [Tepidisphaeraceae bacterium]
MPITKQIAEQIRMRCASGALLPGDRLPSVRQLAQELAVNQNTILRVYERLTAEGLLERRHGDGTYVADRLPGGQLKAQRELLHQEVARLVRRASALGVEPDELHDLIDQALREVGKEPVFTKGSEEA